MRKPFALLALALLLISGEALALSVSWLWGNTFRNDLGYNRKKLTQTLEHFQTWEYGNIFFYYDITEPYSHTNAQASQFFGGMAPTLSLSKWTGKPYSWGWIKDVSLRVEQENGSGFGANNFRNYFYGLQYDLAVPGFDFVTMNTVVRDNPRSPGVGYQIGAFWQKTWDYGFWNKYKFTGFFATSPWNGDQSRYTAKKQGVNYAPGGRYFTGQPQFLYDVGYGLWHKPNRWEMGFEWAYFINRYQIANKTESALQIMTKVTF